MTNFFKTYSEFTRKTQSYFDETKKGEKRCWCFAEYKGQTYVAFSGYGDYEGTPTNRYNAKQYNDLAQTDLFNEIGRKGYILCRLNDNVLSFDGNSKIGYIEHWIDGTLDHITLDKSLKVVTLEDAIKNKLMLNYSCTERKIISKIGSNARNVRIYCKYLPCEICIKFVDTWDYYAMYFDSSEFKTNRMFKKTYHRKY